MKCSLKTIGSKKYDIVADDYVVFDLETTGLADPEIVEIGAVRIHDGKIEDSFSHLCNPRRPIDPEASKVNGITDEMVENEPDIADVLEDFLSFIGNSLLLSHSSNDFDMNILWHSLARNLNCSIDNNYANTLHLCRQVFPQMKKYSLAYLASFFHIDYETAHRALSDAQCAYLVYEYAKPYLAKCDTYPCVCVFGEHDINTVFSSIVEMLDLPDDEMDDIKLRINETSVSISFFNTVAFTVRINSRTQCLDTHNVAAKCYINQIPGATCTKIPSSPMESYHFPLNTTTNAIPFVVDMLRDVYDNMRESANTPSFGCCNDFRRCSDKKECLHKGDKFYRHCGYRKNLEAGRIFYGDNKNI